MSLCQGHGESIRNTIFIILVDGISHTDSWSSVFLSNA